MAVPARAIITLLLVFGLVSNAAAIIYNVGGDGGWTLQPQDSTFYDDQFQNITLYAGDSSTGDGLNFTFAIGEHNVNLVLPEAVANCDASNPLQTSPVPFTKYSSTPATLAFICGFPNHCSQFGMHLIVTFVSPSSPSPSPAPSPESGLDGRGGYNQVTTP